LSSGMPRVGHQPVEQNPRQPSARLRSRRGRSFRDRNIRNCAARRRARTPTCLPKGRTKTYENLDELCRTHEQGGAAKDRIVDKLPVQLPVCGFTIWRCRAPASSMSKAMPCDTCVFTATRFCLRKKQHRLTTSERSAATTGLRNVMDHWRSVLPPGRMSKWSKYEGTREGCRRTGARLIAHCGLDWGPALSCVSRGEASGPYASWSRVRESIYMPALSGVALLWVNDQADHRRARGAPARSQDCAGCCSIRAARTRFKTGVRRKTCRRQPAPTKSTG